MSDSNDSIFSYPIRHLKHPFASQNSSVQLAEQTKILVFIF